MTTQSTHNSAVTRFSFALIFFACMGVAHAQIPVTDIAKITQSVNAQVQTMAQWATQATSMATQIQSMKQQYDSITGPRGMGNLLNNAMLNSALPDDWQAVMSSVKSTAAYATERAKYPTLTNAPKSNALYDTIAGQNATMSNLFATGAARIKQQLALMGQIDSAADPAAKQDLANRLVAEQNAIQANQQLIVTLQAKQQQDLTAASAAAAKEWRCSEFKSSNCV